MDAYSWAGLVVLALCLVLVAFVAAVEAGLISISRARVRLMAGQGVPRAEILHSYILERESLLHALALARNLSILAAAALAVGVITNVQGHSWLMIAGVVVVVMAVAILEAIPRAIVTRNPELWGLRLSRLMGAFKFVFGGVARVLYLPVQAVAYRKVDADEEEMMRLMELEENEGAIEEDERRMIRGVFGLEDTAVREIMTPRPDIVAIDTESTPQEIVSLIIERGFSRIPLYEKNADAILGIVYAKDLFRYLADGALPPRLQDVARPAFFVPESKPVDDLLTDMRKRRVHMAIVVDEHGGTAGLVTIEDMLEEIVGEIEDEHDSVDENILRVSENEAIVDGRISIDELNELFHTTVEPGDFDTVGGCVFHRLGRVPTVGDEVETDGLKLNVLSVDGHRIKRVRITLQPRPLEVENGNGKTNGKRQAGAA